MARYRKKSVIVEAYQYLPTPPECGMEIAPLEGIMTANPGDWIITGVNGERYPCKPDVFKKTYEPAED